MTAMRRIFTLAVAAFTAIALGSCGKENGNNSTSGDLVGTWRIKKFEYKFDGKTIGVETPRKDVDYKPIVLFKDGGECQMDNIPIQYTYSPSTHILGFSMIWDISFSVRRLTSSEMVWSGIFSVKATTRDKEVGEYNGKTIFESNDYDVYSSSYYYKKGNSLIPCEEMDPTETLYTFSGDEDGYYDEWLIYFERVK